MARSASYKNFKSSSKRATAAARGASRKSGTKCEVTLRRALWRLGHRYRVDVRELHGRPDIVFARARVVVFVDGDFWHGRNWPARRRKLLRGSNPDYWIAKIKSNRARDRRNNRLLESDGWRVLRYWESEIRADLDSIVSEVSNVLSRRVRK